MYGGYKPSLAGARAVMRTDQQQRAADQRAAYLARARQQGIARLRTQRVTSRNSTFGPETKYFDVAIDADVTTAGTTWADTEVPCDFYVNSSGAPAAYTDCALIPTAQGSGYGQVDGLKYRIKKLRIRGALSTATLTAQAAVSSGTITRVMLVMDTAPNGNQAQGEDIMQDIGDYGSNAYSFQRVANTGGRFRILKDKWLRNTPAVAGYNAAATTVSESYNNSIFKFQYVPKVPIEVNIKAGNATPTVAGLSNINIFLLAYCYNQSAGGVQTVRIAAASRCYYFD